MILFTYGTLKKKFPNHELLLSVGAKFISEAVTKQVENKPLCSQVKTCLKKFGLVIGTDFNIPALFTDPNRLGENVLGELYFLEDDKIDDVDALEGHPHVYTRSTIDVVNDGEVKKAFAYVIENPHEKIVNGKRLKEYKIENKDFYIPPAKRFQGS